MEALFTLTGGQHRSAEIEDWFEARPDELGNIARHWFSLIRATGDDVTELLHDGCPTACINDVALAYVNVFKAHVNVGFFTGADLPDPDKQLQGSGKRMRHVKVSPVVAGNAPALERLIAAAYDDVKARLSSTKSQ